MMNNNIEMVELNDVALENVVGGAIPAEEFKKVVWDNGIRKIPVVGPMVDSLLKKLGF